MSGPIDYFGEEPDKFRQYKGSEPGEFAVWAAGYTVPPGELPLGFNVQEGSDGKPVISMPGMFGTICVMDTDWCLKFPNGLMRLTHEQFCNTYPHHIQGSK